MAKPLLPFHFPPVSPEKVNGSFLLILISQANSSKVLLHNYPHLQKDQTIYATILERSPLPVHKTYVPNLDIVPSHILLSNTDVELTTAIDHREARLKRELEVIAHNYDYVFIDCPPTLSWLPGRPDAGPTHTGLSEKGRQRLLHNGEGVLLPPTSPHVLTSSGTSSSKRPDTGDIHHTSAAPQEGRAPLDPDSSRKAFTHVKRPPRV